MKNKISLTEEQIDRVIEMAWEDRTPFDAILSQFGLKEQDVIRLMRREMKSSSFKMWRARVQGRSTKHSKNRSEDVERFRCSRQRNISNNKIKNFMTRDPIKIEKNSLAAKALNIMNEKKITCLCVFVRCGRSSVSMCLLLMFLYLCVCLMCFALFVWFCLLVFVFVGFLFVVGKCGLL